MNGRPFSLLAAGLGWLALQGCAALDEAAVGETHRLREVPHYVALAEPQPAPGSCAVALPVTLDPELEQALGYGRRGGEFAPLLEALNARLTASAAGGCVEPGTATLPGLAPRVYVGSAEAEYAPAGVDQERLAHDRLPPMVLYVHRPDAAWRDAAAQLMGQSGRPYLLQAHLGVSQYVKGREGWFRKEVGLGTGYRQPIRFLTAEDKPVEVLHLTGVLVDASGRPVRAGAEGIVLRDTPFIAQTFDLARVFDTHELQAVMATARREDLPESPLQLEVALDNLLAQFTRGTVRVPAR